MKIRVPATTANVGCGYDTFGMALGYYNYVECQEAETTSIKILGQGTQRLPQDGRNLLLRSAQALCDEAGRGSTKMDFIVHNNIPLSRGMGSSSAAIVGGIFAANQVLGQPLDGNALLALAAKIEGHADNVAPALLGGFTITTQEKGLHVRKLSLPMELKGVLAIPDFPVSTQKARAIMPTHVSFADAVYNISHAAYLVASLAEGDLAGFGKMLQDRLHQQYRATLIPGALAVMEAARAAGALGCIISGSGPTMIAFYQGDKELARVIGSAMRKAFKARQVETWIMRTDMDNLGTQVEADEQHAGD